ncbi:bifunctional biotin--[acetyl-CoA-carboxylase] ligase/biotin operon repressor BirA [Pseudoxanthomonas putridarboris]|uniref:Bifunctional ligase/repressor BirA n=1 Tax=Pseudoxanthomonas putridarboris TaxID=752605 RepID=A0ABU9IV35_9GAMM
MSGERELLQRLIEGPVSGDALARDAGLTRAAVWKRIEALREGGVRIDAQPGRGYALAEAMELLDVDAIRAQLAPTPHGQLAALEVAWSLDSTNSELLRRPAPQSGTAVLLAEQQTGGRGRRGRYWASPIASNLYLSLSRQFSGGLARLGGLSLVVGIAVAEALRQAGYPQVALKWPNDLVAQGRKLGGVLVEGGGEHGGPVRAVIGIGVNVRMPMDVAAHIDQPWIDLATLGAPPSRNALAARLVSALLAALDAFDQEGLPPFLPRYAALDALAGREVVLHAADGDAHGVADGIGEDGALRVRIGHEVRHVHAGEVSVRMQ